MVGIRRKVRPMPKADRASLSATAGLFPACADKAQGIVVDIGARYGAFAFLSARLPGRQGMAIDIERATIDAMA